MFNEVTIFKLKKNIIHVFIYTSDPMFSCYPLIIVWRYERGNQNPYIEEEHTTQGPKEKVQKDKQRSTKHTHKTIDRVTRTPLKSGGELRFSGRLGSSCSNNDTRPFSLVTNPVIRHEWGKEREVFTTRGTYPWSFVTQIFHNGQPSHVGDLIKGKLRDFLHVS